MDTVSEKLKHKLSLRPPPKILVEKYLIEISKNYNVPYEPDLQVRPSTDTMLLINVCTIQSIHSNNKLLIFVRTAIIISIYLNVKIFDFRSCKNMNNLIV